MRAATVNASSVRCLTENGGYVLICLSGDDEVARIALTPEGATAARAAIDRAMLLDVKLQSLAGSVVARPEVDEYPPLRLDEACVVVGAALRRVAAGDTVVGFELFPVTAGRFDWSLVNAGPLGALYDSAVREVLGAQAGAPRGTPMTPPIVDLSSDSGF